jgi:hypothetical protein
MNDWRTRDEGHVVLLNLSFGNDIVDKNRIDGKQCVTAEDVVVDFALRKRRIVVAHVKLDEW